MIRRFPRNSILSADPLVKLIRSKKFFETIDFQHNIVSRYPMHLLALLFTRPTVKLLRTCKVQIAQYRQQMHLVDAFEQMNRTNPITARAWLEEKAPDALDILRSIDGRSAVITQLLPQPIAEELLEQLEFFRNIEQ